MTNAKRDSNRVPNVVVVDTNGNPAYLKVDPTTGKLLVASVSSTPTSVLPRTTAHRDSDRKAVGLALDNSANGTEELLIDHTTGYIMIDNA